MYGAGIEFIYERHADPLINDSAVVDEVTKVTEQLIPADHIIHDMKKSLSADDFAAYLTKAPGMYGYVGTRNIKKGSRDRDPLSQRPLQHRRGSPAASCNVYVDYALAYLNGCLSEQYKSGPYTEGPSHLRCSRHPLVCGLDTFFDINSVLLDSVSSEQLHSLRRHAFSIGLKVLGKSSERPLTLTGPRWMTGFSEASASSTPAYRAPAYDPVWTVCPALRRRVHSLR